MRAIACAATRAEPLATIKTPAVEFHADACGARPRAVFLHGFSADLHTWNLLWQELQGSLPALRYDLRGFGKSVVAHPAPFDHAEDLQAVLDASAIESCDLIGVSMGGAVALNFALDHPDRVRNLVLISPGMVGWEWSPAWRALWRPIVTCARERTMDEARRLWWQHPLFETTRQCAAAPALRESIDRFAGQQWLHDEHRIKDSDIERLHQLQLRTLLLTGGRDFQDFRLIASLIEASAGNVQRMDDPACGHLIHLEAASGCADKIAAFLD